MKFKIDENLPSELAADLLALGHEADTVVDEGLAGSEDRSLMERVRIEQRIFLTMDKGIADIREYPPDQFAGLVLFRPAMQGRSATLEFIRRRLASLLTFEFRGRLLVVTEAGIRAR
jgi:hypothetical protein